MQCLLNALPVFLGEGLEEIVDDTHHEVAQSGRLASLNLQQQTLLQVAGTDACGVEGLQDAEHVEDIVS